MLQSDEDVYSFLASCAFLGLVLVRDDGTGPANMKALRRLSELVDGKRYYGLSRDGNWDLRKLRPIVQGKHLLKLVVLLSHTLVLSMGIAKHFPCATEPGLPPAQKGFVSCCTPPDS